MKSLFKFLDILAGIILILMDLLEILVFPALLVLVGLLNSYPWQYYALTIGGYFVIVAVLQLILHLIFRKFEKKYSSAVERLFQRLFPPKEGTNEQIRI